VSLEALQGLVLSAARSIASTWALAFAVSALLFVVFRGFFGRRRIQPGVSRRRVLRHELLFSALSVSMAGALLGALTSALERSGAIELAPGPAPWYRIAGEIGLYFLSFDLYFYLTHRLMHLGPVYRWIHSAHHASTAPGPLTAFSFNPLEAALTGSFLPFFLAALDPHALSVGVIAVLLGPVLSILVHSGHEIFPAWWYGSPFTKWLLTPMYHDQHHQLFHCNYGGFTTLWDRAFGTMSPSFAEDFARFKERAGERAGPPLGAPAS
jgi:sterol desaturase/sphingolipid hydroxylase (fatty acid hydroxylase superfamily)